MPIFAAHLVSKSDAENYETVIPFYILKKYETKTKNTANLCDIYIQNTTKHGLLPKKTAIVICLKIRRLYELDGLIKNRKDSELQKSIMQK